MASPANGMRQTASASRVLRSQTRPGQPVALWNKSRSKPDAPLEWVGSLDICDEVICEELNFNDFRCKPAPVPQASSPSDPIETQPNPKEQEEPWIWGITDN
ncbi:metalloprotease 1 [Cordyceps fumosorosea ARSEF 2679]|uniref:Metalloprotease 1 n=1 Tax=Cordyceps fumosorosea (strain ARSEF 2679) TaxID=1081104 RepID=A0A167LVP7_CORFA|nr:metalloprotease 1 [Cordyceps fumosorosea ARSEF 2679]OAA53576.1 metalloprotease 1 [Cordyceps fumosorosea ARSEF 2679]